LKDFKSLIQEKNEPSSIRKLRKSLLALILSVIIVTFVILIIKSVFNTVLAEGVDSVKNSQERNDILMQVVFSSR
jgi:fructose-specific phosphotransferase system IIC component